MLHATWAIGPRVVFDVRGAVRQSLSIKAREASPAVDLDPAVREGTTRDVGDFELAVSFAPIGRREGFFRRGAPGCEAAQFRRDAGHRSKYDRCRDRGALLLGVRALAGHGWFGVGILEVPAQPFEQNDAFAYAFESHWRATPDWRVSVGTRGRASTRRVSPPGAGDLGEVRATLEWRRGPIAVDAGVGHGYTEMSGAWTLRAGVAWLLHAEP